MPVPKGPNAYDRVLSAVFAKHWHEGLTEVLFSKDDLIDEAARLGVRIKNLADVLYAFRSRRALPEAMRTKGNWVIASRGAGLYAFVIVEGESKIHIPPHLKVYDIPYAVPEIVADNLAEDEQGLLTIVRYNRLLDVFTGLACFHLQPHMRTHVKGHGQVEVDDLYVGVDKDGQGFVLPVEAKDIGESLGVDKAVGLTLFAHAKYPKLICRPIAVVREKANHITCVEFEPTSDLSKVAVLEIRRYRLAPEAD